VEGVKARQEGKRPKTEAEVEVETP
jgi:hypothetical protein